MIMCFFYYTIFFFSKLRKCFIYQQPNNKWLKVYSCYKYYIVLHWVDNLVMTLLFVDETCYGNGSLVSFSWSYRVSSCSQVYSLRIHRDANNKNHSSSMSLSMQFYVSSGQMSLTDVSCIIRHGDRLHTYSTSRCLLHHLSHSAILDKYQIDVTHLILLYVYAKLPKHHNGNVHGQEYTVEKFVIPLSSVSSMR